MKTTFVIQLVAILVLNLSCANIFSEMADKTTDKALLYETNLRLGRGDWDGALNQIALMSTEFRGRRDVQVLKSGAYAGKCGLNFIDLVLALQGDGTDGLFAILLAARTGATQINLDNCIFSEEILVSLGTESTRTVDENLRLAFLSLIKVANILNLLADADGDGEIDAGWDPCGVAGNTNMPTRDIATRADATEIVTGLALFLTSITAAGAGASAGEFYDSINTLCTALGASNPCQATRRDDVDPDGIFHTKAVRALITADDDGIGLAINPDDAATCLAGVCLLN